MALAGPPGDADALAGRSSCSDGGVEVEALVRRGLVAGRSQFTWTCAVGLARLYRTRGSRPRAARRPWSAEASRVLAASALRRSAGGTEASEPTSSACSRDSDHWPVRERRPRVKLPELPTLTAWPAAPGPRSGDPLSTLGYRAPTVRVLTGPRPDQGVGPRDRPGPVRFRRVHAESTGHAWSRARRPLVVTVHDLFWRRIPDAYPPAGGAGTRPRSRRAERRADRSSCPPSRRRTTWRRPARPDGCDHGDPDGLRPPASSRPRRGRAPTSSVWGVDGPFLLCVGTLEPAQEPAAPGRGLSGRSGTRCPNHGRW